ncbi:MAG: hypothetical protein ABEN55_10425 [Bradymonadaceae bacterium]
MTGASDFSHGDGQSPARGYLVGFDENGDRTSTTSFGQSGDVLPHGIGRDRHRQYALYVGGATLGTIDGASSAETRSAAFLVRFD